MKKRRRQKRVIRHHEVLLRLNKDLWELVRVAAAREGIPMYKLVEEALATRVRWTGKTHGMTTPPLVSREMLLRAAKSLRPPTSGDLLRVTRAFHEKKDAELF